MNTIKRTPKTSLGFLYALLWNYFQLNYFLNPNNVYQCHALSSSPQYYGTGKSPLQKQKVSVFGGGGYLGANIFGMLQRAGSIYGTGLAVPQNIGATGYCAQLLNKVLGNNFKLAFADESCIGLTDMTDVDAITERLVLSKSSFVVMGTVYQMEERPVTANTYEGMNPNAKAYEFYLDRLRSDDSGRDDVAPTDVLFHSGIFERTIEACVKSNEGGDGVKHVVIVETPRTRGNEDMKKACANVLFENRKDLSFTYIRCLDEIAPARNDFTYESGVYGVFDVSSIEMNADCEKQKWDETFSSSTQPTERKTTREDLAAVVVQSIISLDSDQSRIIDLSTKSAAIQVEIKQIGKKVQRTDKEWCVRSDSIAEKMTKMK